MCGICGAAGISDGDILADMASCLVHRGPEDRGTYRDDRVMLANQRLRIIDIEGGDQPIYNEHGDVVVVYNGEIYNFQTLREELRNAGHTFTTDTDTEVLVHGYEEYGTDLFARLSGMFAVALWDRSADRLYLIRDRAGIKPLYYAPAEDGILFASEPKSILQSGLVEPVVDTDALEYFLQMRYSPSTTSLFDGIETVLPGTYLELGREREGWEVTERRFWSLADTPSTAPAAPVSAMRRTLRTAIERQLVSDVPLGFYLSGGLDTSSVVATASELSDDPIHTFCMGFDDTTWDERPDARAVADHFGTIHHEIEIENDFLRDFPEMIWHADEPKRNLYPYYVAREMSEHVTVALGGLGADELFGGYVYRFNRLRDLQNLRTLPERTRKTLAETATRLADLQLTTGVLEDDTLFEDVDVLRHLDDPARLYVLLNSSDVIGDPRVLRERAFGENLDGDIDPGAWIEQLSPVVSEDLREQALRWDYEVKMSDDFLLVEDRMSMAHTLESRVPFLDNDLIDLAFSLPLSAKFETNDRSVGKAILREAMREKLPATVFEKDKQGFTMPTYPFVRDELLDHARAILDDPAIVREGLIDESYLGSLLDRNPSRDLVPHYKLLWRLVALEIWYRMYIIEGAEGPREIEHYYS